MQISRLHKGTRSQEGMVVGWSKAEMEPMGRVTWLTFECDQKHVCPQWLLPFPSFPSQQRLPGDFLDLLSMPSKQYGSVSMSNPIPEASL